MKNSFVCLFLAVAAVTLASGARAEEGHGPLSNIDWLIGDWYVTITEQDSDGSMTRDAGHRRYQWVHETMMRCETYVGRQEATGRHEGSEGVFAFTYYFVPKIETGEVLRVGLNPAGEPSVSPWHFDEQSGELRYSGEYVHSQLGIAMTIEARLFKVSEDEFRIVEELHGIDDPYSETVTLSAIRFRGE